MENVIYMSNNGVSTISLNRPEKYNALDGQTLIDLLETIKIIKENDDKIVILTGEAPAFCAGGDINSMTDFASSDQLDRKSTRLNSSHVAISYAVFCLIKK